LEAESFTFNEKHACGKQGYQNDLTIIGLTALAMG
jgi:hypothetical protein